MFNEIALLVHDANPGRHHSNLRRRVVKMIEELGEIAEAWLNVTSSSNGKSKSWDDVREEITDCLIVALDIAWTLLPDEANVPTPVMQDEPDLTMEESLFRIIYRLSLFATSTDLPLARYEIGRVVSLTAALAMAAIPEDQLIAGVKRKLEKWANNRSTMMVVTDDV